MKLSKSFFYHPWAQSLFLHLLMALFFVFLTLKKSPQKEIVDVPLYLPPSPPEEVQKLTEVKKKPKVVLKSINQKLEPSVRSQKKVREVFGASKKSYTDSTNTSGVNVKKGNTIAKEVDDKVLNPDDAESLPVPTEEFLVSKMPIVMTEIRPAYPREAKEKELEGVVILDILIDENGRVRDPKVVEGDRIFQKASLEAIKKFSFRAAEVDGKKVAVRIRYSLRFELEY